MCTQSFDVYTKSFDVKIETGGGGELSHFMSNTHSFDLKVEHEHTRKHTYE
jgi:hypothetical protein